MQTSNEPPLNSIWQQHSYASHSPEGGLVLAPYRRNLRDVGPFYLVLLAIRPRTFLPCFPCQQSSGKPPGWVLQVPWVPAPSRDSGSILLCWDFCSFMTPSALTVCFNEWAFNSNSSISLKLHAINLPWRFGSSHFSEREISAVSVSVSLGFCHVHVQREINLFKGLGRRANFYFIKSHSFCSSFSNQQIKCFKFKNKQFHSDSLQFVKCPVIRKSEGWAYMDSSKHNGSDIGQEWQERNNSAGRVADGTQGLMRTRELLPHNWPSKVVTRPQWHLLRS